MTDKQPDSPLIRDMLEAGDSPVTASTRAYPNWKIAEALRQAMGSATPPTQKIRYGDWHIYLDPPPIPTRNCDWHFYHDDYDGAPDANDHRAGSGADVKDCIDQIKDIEDDLTTRAWPTPPSEQIAENANCLAGELAALLTEASDGPWAYRPHEYDDWGVIRGPERHEDWAEYPIRPVVGQARHSDLQRDELLSDCRKNKSDPWAGDAKLMVWFRNNADTILSHLQAAPSGDVVEALQLLSDAADKLNGSIDEQTYDERLKLQDYPDDQEFHVVITAKQEKDFNAAIFAAQTKLRSLTTPPSNQEAALLREALGMATTALEWYGDEVLTYAITQRFEPCSAAHGDKGKKARSALDRIEAHLKATEQ